MPSPSDIDAEAMVTVNSNWLVRESASSRRSQVKSELVPNYPLLLLTALMHLMRAFIEILLCLWNLSHEAQKHVRFVIVP